MSFRTQMTVSPLFAIGFLCALFFIGGVWIPLIERRSTYYPTREWEALPSQVDLLFEEVVFRAADGVALCGWWMPAEGGSRGAVIFFHGNAGNISHRLLQAQVLHALGFDLLLAEYRGYGKSEGKPSERGFYADAEAAREFIIEKKAAVPSRLVYYGESLGAAVAVDLAVKHPPAALVLEAPFLSIPEMAKRYYPWLPGWLLRSRYDNLSKVGGIDSPTLILHSRDDEITPFFHSERLLQASAAHRKRLLPLMGGHNGAFFAETRRIAVELGRFLSENGF